MILEFPKSARPASEETGSQREPQPGFHEVYDLDGIRAFSEPDRNGKCVTTDVLTTVGRLA